NYQDNMISYGLLKGPWLSRLSYSPNAGVASRVSAVRAPGANEVTGRVLGGATAGTETSSRRGEAAGAMLSYSANDVRVIGAFHYNKFGVPFGLFTSTGYLPLYFMDSFRSFTVGAKHRVAPTGSEMAANFYRGQFRERGNQDPRVTVLGFAAKQPI